MLTINYHSVKDVNPVHDQEVIVLELTKRFGNIYLNSKEITTELHWQQYNEKGYATGTSICYKDSTDSEYKVGDTLTDPFDSELSLQLEWINSSDYIYWIDSKQYLDSILKDLNENI